MRYGEISSIDEVSDISVRGLSMDGYVVMTDKTRVRVLIENGQCCCESWGYLCSEDDSTPYIGSQLRGVVLTDTALNRQKVAASDYYECAGGIQFVDFVTDRGVFQIAVYNGHNGYYGHEIHIDFEGGSVLLECIL